MDRVLTLVFTFTAYRIQKHFNLIATLTNYNATEIVSYANEICPSNFLEHYSLNSSLAHFNKSFDLTVEHKQQPQSFNGKLNLCKTLMTLPSTEGSNPLRVSMGGSIFLIGSRNLG